MSLGWDVRVSTSQLIRVGTLALRRSRIPRYTSKYSRKDYTVHEHLVFLAIKELEKHSYRSLADRLADSRSVARDLRLKKTPHWTTSQKFLARIPPAWFHLLLRRLADAVGPTHRVALDATNWRQDAASTHYVWRVGRRMDVRDSWKSVDAVDTDTGLVVASLGTAGLRGEAPHAVPLLDRCGRVVEVTADAAFDTHRVHRWAEQKGASDIVKLKGGSSAPSKGIRLRLLRARRADPATWAARYGRRNLVEATYHAVKARTGERLVARSWWMRNRLHFLKLVAYDLQVIAARFPDLFRAYLEGFLQSPPTARVIS